MWDSRDGEGAFISTCIAQAMAISLPFCIFYCRNDIAQSYAEHEHGRIHYQACIFPLHAV